MNTYLSVYNEIVTSESTDDLLINGIEIINQISLVFTLHQWSWRKHEYIISDQWMVKENSLALFGSQSRRNTTQDSKPSGCGANNLTVSATTQTGGLKLSSYVPKIFTCCK